MTIRFLNLRLVEKSGFGLLHMILREEQTSSALFLGWK